ncbi:hypothetical protein [Kitasatospora sp. NPDC057223]|uniref:hypothetical protein n=1 Tax=Kitasatospora sp. NPDC057223 TaxID=3346055 RepID=UPI0036390641
MQQLLHHENPLTAAFPAELAQDVLAVLAVMPPPRWQPAEPFSVQVQGRQVTIPSRLYSEEPPVEAVDSLPERRRTILHCLYTRHHDGRVRQRHLEQVIGTPEPWVVPFVVQLVGEYVLEILVAIGGALGGLGVPGSADRSRYGRFIADNPAFFARTERRVVSYWNCYHRTGYAGYADFAGYPGCTLLALLRAAAEEHGALRVPSLAPSGSTRLDGYC